MPNEVRGPQFSTRRNGFDSGSCRASLSGRWRRVVEPRDCLQIPQEGANAGAGWDGVALIIQQAQWRRQYRHESPEHKNWDLVVRGTRDLLMRLPEALDGVILKKTTDPVSDLLGPMSIKAKDRRSFKASIELLLADGFLVRTADDVLLIRNFRQAQTGSSAADLGASTTLPTSRAVAPELSVARAEAGRRGGLKAQAAKQVASSKGEQTAEQNLEQTEQTAKQVASSKPSNLLPRDPEDKRREEKNSNENDDDLKTYQDVPRPLARASGAACEPRTGEAETAAAIAARVAELNRDRFAMYLPWVPTPEVVAGLEIAGVPPWAIDELIGRFRVHFISSPAEISTEAEWSQRCSKWVLRDWRNPKTRPEKPAPAPAAGDLGAYGKAGDWS